jgi:hypothetical protein
LGTRAGHPRIADACAVGSHDAGPSKGLGISTILGSTTPGLQV